MAKAVLIPAVSVSVDLTVCGECSRAFGFCLKGASGRPICCRCSLDDRFLRMVTEPSCGRFARRGTPLPEEFSFGISPRKDGTVPVL